MMKKHLVHVASACALGCIAASAQSADTDFVKQRLATIAKSHTAENAFMGAVLVAAGDQILLDKGYGMANLEWNVPDAPDVRFRVCSITKQFTAALVLLLQQDGKLRIDDPVGKYLPNAPKSWAKITLADLLDHTSGIPDRVSDPQFESWSMSPHTVAEQMAYFFDRPLDFEPGSKFAYSNSNYVVLGVVIEHVSGKKYEQLLHERILDPLGMKNTGMDTDELVLPKRAYGYAATKTGLQAIRTVSMSLPWASGSMYSTTGDLLRWERALFGGQVLNKESLKRMTTAGKGNYGLGVEVDRHDGVQVVQHGGAVQGFNAQLSYVPERKIAVIVLSNVNGTATATMGAQLLDVALGKTVILPSERRPVPIAKEELSKFTGIYDVSPAFSITIAQAGDSLTAQGSSQPRGMPMIYQGITAGHPRFYIPKNDAEIEFVPDSTGKVTSLVVHNGGDRPAKKR